ncbi:glycosyltransferase [Arthrobacter sp. E918]|uniref:Glycosyltransferase n=1 Tax=Arthrobacter mobilis TaxID=2724944 RepID=A0A7X6HDA2_9MICC|nr:glycosyltransferase [Arthrobacter mobilis]
MLEISGDGAQVPAVLHRLRSAGADLVRYPLRWHRIEQAEGHFDWTSTDAELALLRELGFDPVVDLVHHTSYPAWLSDGFRDRRFGPAYVRYAAAVAARYPWLQHYTLFNEPFATLFLAGHEALWPPYDHGMDGFVRLLRNVLPALAEAASIWSGELPGARHVWVDTCEHHAGTAGAPARYAALANDRRHIVLDLAMHHDLDESRPFLGGVLRAGAADLLQLPPLRIDVLGLDYYAHSEWWYDEAGGHAPSPHPLGFAAVAQQYGDRYGLPMMLTETNLRGLPPDRASWLRHMLEQYDQAAARGVDLRGFCWFPVLDSCDWDSLLARPAGRRDPVGILGPEPGGLLARNTFTAAWEAAVAGAGARALPAYRFQAPCDAQLAGFLPLMKHWPWQDPPADETIPPLSVSGKEPIMTNTQVADLVVFSHLRWDWVWQRPQHLVTRFAKKLEPARTWFVEEPVPGDVAGPVLRRQDCGAVTRVWLEIPRHPGQPAAPGFGAPGAEAYGALVRDLLAGLHRPVRPTAFLFTPMAFDAAMTLDPGLLCYDVMDDLAAFAHAPEGLRLRQRRLLAEADIVFAGGRTLYRSVLEHRNHGCHLFPSGVDGAHYARSRQLRAAGGQRAAKVAGYVGVIDERLDLELVAGLASALPDWTIQMVGPVAKIDPAGLPRAANIEYPGMAAYAELPAVMAGFDVALMPFALNEATRSISPTKTLEYLAAGLPVVSTPVADVVAGYPGIVHFAADAPGFARACLEAAQQPLLERDRKSAELRARHDWDAIAAAMLALMDTAATAAGAQDGQEETA